MKSKSAPTSPATREQVMAIVLQAIKDEAAGQGRVDILITMSKVLDDFRNQQS